jgi:SanA protein
LHRYNIVPMHFVFRYMLKIKLKRVFTFSIVALVIIICVVLAVDYKVTNKASKYLYSSVAEIPHNKVGLLLGTSKYTRYGINTFYKYRIEAAVSLYKAGKIDKILISGDNGTKTYNEPEMMRDDLVAAGIPLKDIKLDYAGFRTFDSIKRGKVIFGVDKMTIISQQFHNERALYIAHYHDVDAIAFNAKEVQIKYAPKTYVREKLARVKMMIDLVINKEPKFYGEKEFIDE